MLKKHLNKENLHHAYLIEGEPEVIFAELKTFMESNGFSFNSNPDFFHKHFDSFKVDDARGIKSLSTTRSFSGGKKVFLISINNFLIEAQNMLLKLFEEPIPDTHFFIVMPDLNSLTKTILSRCYVLRKEDSDIPKEEAESFISMSMPNRLNYIKDLLTEEEEFAINSPRSKSMFFLNALESALYEKNQEKPRIINKELFGQIFEARKYLRSPGSSAKSILEALALNTPNL